MLYNICVYKYLILYLILYFKNLNLIEYILKYLKRKKNNYFEFKFSNSSSNFKFLVEFKFKYKFLKFVEFESNPDLVVGFG